MDAHEHIVVGIVITVLFYLFMAIGFEWFDKSPVLFAIALIVGAFFCLLPDIDLRNSTVTWFFLGLSICGILISILFQKFNLPFLDNIINLDALLWASLGLLICTFLLGQFAGHRGFVHTLWFGLIPSSLLYFIVPNYQICVLAYVAYYSHLAADDLWFKLV